MNATPNMVQAGPAAKAVSVAILFAALLVAFLWDWFAIESPAVRHVAHVWPHAGCLRCCRRSTRRAAELGASQAFEHSRMRRAARGAICG
jgi:hypothetical protein